MGGLGKTTLARKVYKHRDVKRYFDGFAWICVSQQWKSKDILQSILVKLEPERKEEFETWKEDDLINHLFLVQQQRKCLIFLDDIWTTDAWECIKPAFPSRQNGSKILLTTRNKDVALHIGPDGFHHEPRLLNGDESWDLLQRKALLHRDGGHGHNMDDMAKLGKKLVEECGGLPLAVIVLGGILSTKKSLSEWENVYKNIKAYLWEGEIVGGGKGKLEKNLGLSYYDMPFELKPCFLYLGSFPEDAEISAVNIYQLWMAEGLIVQNSKKTESLMELAELYLGQLGQRGMVQLKASDIPWMRRRIKSCRLHDLMRDLCLREAEDGNFMSRVGCSSKGKLGDLPHVSSISKFRRLVISFDGANDTVARNSQDKEILKYLRMVRFEIPGDFKNDGIERYLFEMLRVMSFETRVDFQHQLCLKLPKFLGGLIHLRYLSMRGSPFARLPSSLANLKHLQTLDVSRSVLPSNAQNFFVKMTELVCLYLPRVSGKCKVPLRLHGLDKLEILKNFNDGGYETKDLIKLPNLRVLKVSSCRKLKNMEMIARYVKSNNRLEDVEIYASYFNVDKVKGLMVLKQMMFESNIRTLSTNGPLWKLPEYDPGTPSNLLELYIYGSSLNLVESIKTLEQYTFLRSLHINSDSAEGKDVCFHAAGFPQLQNLNFSNSHVETLVVKEGAMSNLQTLFIWCEKLQVVPQGLRFISCLETLEFYRMAKEFKDRIRTPDGSPGEDFHIVSHVPFVIFID